MRKASQWKSVYCLEGLWGTDLRSNSTVEPVLGLLNKQYDRLKYIHGDCATISELDFYLEKWTQKAYDGYPILYLAFHGEERSILLSDGRVNLDHLADILEDACLNRIIVFASCSTLATDKRFIKSFMRKTGCLAVCGYKSDVDWVKSTAFELLLIEGMQDNEFSGRGIKAIQNYLENLANKSFKELEFRMVIKSEL